MIDVVDQGGKCTSEVNERVRGDAIGKVGIDFVWVLFAGLGLGGQRNDFLDLVKNHGSISMFHFQHFA
jgi:hypothetical protein